MSKPSFEERVKEVGIDLWWHANEIWAACRGLGWTLDSERATKLIRKHLTEAVDECVKEVASLNRKLSNDRAGATKLRKTITERNREIRRLTTELQATRETLQNVITQHQIKLPEPSPPKKKKPEPPAVDRAHEKWGDMYTKHERKERDGTNQSVADST